MMMNTKTTDDASATMTLQILVWAMMTWIAANPASPTTSEFTVRPRMRSVSAVVTVVAVVTMVTMVTMVTIAVLMTMAVTRTVAVVVAMVGKATVAVRIVITVGAVTMMVE